MHIQSITSKLLDDSEMQKLKYKLKGRDKTLTNQTNL